VPGGETPSHVSMITLEAAERAHILKVLAQTNWRVAGKDGAAQRLGLKRTTLNSKMKKLNIQRPVT
jgi:formate hydrogenlyase transcriptional activator